jgi:hypothetical protein
MTDNSIYVSNSGNDTTGDGTQSNPYLTLAYVSTILSNSTTIYLEKDSEFVNDKLTIDGKNNIIVDSYGSGDAPKINGFKEVSGWTDEGGNIWSKTDSNFPDEITNVFIDGVRGEIGRLSERSATGGDESTLIDSGLTDPDGYWNGAEIQIRYWDWSRGISRVSDFTSNTFTFPIYYQDEETGYFYSVSAGKKILDSKSCKLFIRCQ